MSEPIIQCTDHFWGIVPHFDDGITYQTCLDCGEVAGPVMCSGVSSSPFGDCCPGFEILPARPCFHDPEKEREWMRLWIKNQLQGGGYVDPLAYAAALEPVAAEKGVQ